MTRPGTIGEPTVTYNVIMKERQLQKLRRMAHQNRRDGQIKVSTASLLRDAVDEYIERMEDEEDKVWQEVTNSAGA